MIKIRTITKIKIIIILIMVLLIFNIGLYTLDRTINPTVVTVADAKVKERSINIINKSVLDEFGDGFDYNNVIHVEKDTEGNIVMLKADTLKMNRIACQVAIRAQRELKNAGEEKIEIPFGYIFKNNLIANMGPNVIVKAEPIGSIETEYLSHFESAGLNQTRHKIYIEVKTSVKVILPMSSSEINIKSDMPISETIIVGKVPNTAVQFDLKSAGFKLP